MEENYYWSDDTSAAFYAKAAQLGFITTSMYKDNQFVLLPEIQFDYAILDFKDIIISKKVKKLLKKDNYTLKVNNDFEAVCEAIENYHEDSWMKKEYISILKCLKNDSILNEKFKLMSIELYENEQNRLISGEIGYKIKNIYTSLTGFTTKEKKYNNWGKMQLVLLNTYLEENGYSFWNLGHPQLQYKIDLGAKVYSREEFLKRWKSNI